jgi:hypothetical protein
MTVNRETAREVLEEIKRARKLYPEYINDVFMLAVLMEEVGELAQAIADKLGPERVRAEAAQVACVAIRIIEEGESRPSLFPAGLDDCRKFDASGIGPYETTEDLT